MDEDRILGSWRVKSGNVCYAALVLDAHRAVNIRFTWNRPPIAEDYQDFETVKGAHERNNRGEFA